MTGIINFIITLITEYFISLGEKFSIIVENLQNYSPEIMRILIWRLFSMSLSFLIVIRIVKKKSRRKTTPMPHKPANYNPANYRTNEIKNTVTENVSNVNNTSTTENSTEDYFREAYRKKGYTDEEIDKIEANGRAIYERLHGVKLPTSN